MEIIYDLSKLTEIERKAIEKSRAKILARTAHPQRFYNLFDEHYKIPSPKDMTVWDMTVIPARLILTMKNFQCAFVYSKWATYWHDVNTVGLQDEPHVLITWCQEEERLHTIGVFPDLICQEVRVGNGVVSIGDTYNLTLKDIEVHSVRMTYTRVEMCVIRIISNWFAFGRATLGYTYAKLLYRYRLKLRKKIRYQKYKDMMGLRTKDLVSIAMKGKPNDT